MSTPQPNIPCNGEKIASQAARIRLNKLFYEAYMIPRAIYVAAELGVADSLTDGPKDTKDIAAAVGANPDALYRLLRALAIAGLFTEAEPSHFALTPLGACLLRDTPASLRAYISLYGSNLLTHAADNLLHSVRTGTSAFREIYGAPLFQYLSDHNEAAKLFDAGMTSISSLDINDVLSVYDFSGINKIADIGGGRGGFLASVLVANPTMRGLLFDLAPVIERARPQIDMAGIAHRCYLVAGNFFETIPCGADAYVLKSIIHDWDDERSITILRNCRRAMADKTRLLVIEPVILPDEQSSLSKFVDLMMLAMTEGGRERTEEDFRVLFDAAGFELTRIIPTGSRVSIVEGVAV